MSEYHPTLRLKSVRLNQLNQIHICFFVRLSLPSNSRSTSGALLWGKTRTEDSILRRWMDGWRASLQRRRLRVLCVICCWWNGGWLTPSGAVKQRLARRRGWEESTPLFFIAPSASHHANIGQTHQRCVITANTAKY